MLKNTKKYQNGKMYQKCQQAPKISKCIENTKNNKKFRTEIQKGTKNLEKIKKFKNFNVHFKSSNEVTGYILVKYKVFIIFITNVIRIVYCKTRQVLYCF